MLAEIPAKLDQEISLCLLSVFWVATVVCYYSNRYHIFRHIRLPVYLCIISFDSRRRFPVNGEVWRHRTFCTVFLVSALYLWIDNKIFWGPDWAHTEWTEDDLLPFDETPCKGRPVTNEKICGANALMRCVEGTKRNKTRQKRWQHCQTVSWAV